MGAPDKTLQQLLTMCCGKTSLIWTRISDDSSWTYQNHGITRLPCCNLRRSLSSAAPPSPLNSVPAALLLQPSSCGSFFLPCFSFHYIYNVSNYLLKRTNPFLPVHHRSDLSCSEAIVNKKSKITNMREKRGSRLK